MYKALIVDDERLIRLGMRRAIPWASIGIGEVYVAQSGPEALRIIREHRPEIMVTDIKMDGMSGLELIDQANAFAPDMRVLVLTGYDDFECARRCIQLKVNDFFLKPIDEAKLIEAVRKQVDSLEDSRAGLIVDTRANRARAVAEQMSIEKQLRDMVHGRADAAQMEAFAERYALAQAQPVRAAVLVLPPQPDGDKDEAFFASLTLKQICIDMVDAPGRGLTFMDDSGRIAIAFFPNQQKDCSLEWLQELNEILRDEFPEAPRAALGCVASELWKLRESYLDAVQLLEQDRGQLDGIIRPRHALNQDDQDRRAFEEIKAQMCLSADDSVRALGLFDQFCKMAQAHGFSDAAVLNGCFDLASSVFFRYLCLSGKQADDRLAEWINRLMQSHPEARLEITQTFLAQLLDGREDQRLHELVDKAKRHIVDHLADELSVSDIAAALYVTPSYLSRLFKKVTGEGCYEYVVRKRIAKAKRLLETTELKTFEIAEMVGYNDTNYFSLALKKNTGMSPQKYRKECQK